VLADLRDGLLLDPAFERRAAGLDGRDRRWLQELVYGLLRRRAWTDTVLEGRVRGGLGRLDVDLVDLLRLGVQQLVAMGSVPAYAAINQTVELAKRRHGPGAGSLANAVLRRVDRDRAEGGVAALTPPAPADPVDRLALAYSHPHWLVARWMERWGADEAERLLAANNVEAPTVARPYGVTPDGLAAALGADGVAVEPAPAGAVWPPGSVSIGTRRGGADRARRLPARAVPRAGPGQHVGDDLRRVRRRRDGGRPVRGPRRQGAGAGAHRGPGALGRPRAGAPGARGRQRAPARRAQRLPVRGRRHGRAAGRRRRGRRAGGRAVHRHRHLPPPPDARWRIQPSDLAVLPAEQRGILAAAARLVRPGGLLVYSTCSVEREENDEPVDAFLAARPDFAVEPPPAGLVPDELLDGGRLRVLPQRHGTDGAFAARLRRRTG
jgi:16S rRNA (cytosine967-C5)-methyltransferase